MSRHSPGRQSVVRLAFGLAALAASFTAPPPAVLAAPGELDVSFGGFGVSGKVRTQQPSGWTDVDMALQPDGMIVVASHTEDSATVMRYLANGALDMSFGHDGQATLSSPEHSLRAMGVAVQPDGRIVIAGWADTQPADFLVARFTPTGSPDPTFGSGGYVETDFDNDTDQAKAVLVQPDGKIVAVGRARIDGDYDFAVARYNSDGSLDTTFAGDGKGSAGFGGEDEANAVALQADGKLVLAGTKNPLGGLDFAVARFTSTGTPDTSFGFDGEVTTDFGAFDWANAVTVQSDAKIVVAGGDGIDGRIARYRPDGSLDPTLDTDGKLTIRSIGQLNDVARQPDGKLMLLGHRSEVATGVMLALHRLNPDISADTSFGDGGSSFIDLPEGDFGQAIALQADGRIVGAGVDLAGNHGLVRLWPDGTLDDGGKQTLGFDQPGFPPGSHETAHAMAVQADGGLVVAGTIREPVTHLHDAALTRFLPNGLVDTSFGLHGQVLFGFGEEDVFHAVAVQSDGKILAAGYTDPFGNLAKNFMIARFNPDGTLDSSFGFFGYNIVDFQGGDDYGTAMALAPGGKIVVAGPVWTGARHDFGVARFNSDGTLDTSFSGDGKAVQSWGKASWVYAVVIQSDGRVVVGGFLDGDFAILRFNENGTLDTLYGNDGGTITDMGGLDVLNALVIMPGDWIVAAGVRDIGGQGDFALAEFRVDGALATCARFPCSSWREGKMFVDLGGYEMAFALERRPDGQVVVAGCADGRFAWAQMLTYTKLGGSEPVVGMASFPGGNACGSSVRFVGADRIVVAGTQSYFDDQNIALAGFRTTTDNAVGTPTPSPSPTLTPSATASATATGTASPTATATALAATSSPTATATTPASPTATETAIETATATVTVTVTPTNESTPVAASATPTATPPDPTRTPPSPAPTSETPTRETPVDTAGHIFLPWTTQG